MPLWFEDFAAMGADEALVSPGRTVTEADVVSFAATTGDYNPMHTDAVAAAGGRFGERVAHGALGLSWCLGLSSRTGAFEGSALALLGIENWEFRAPLRFGDTVHTRARVTGTRMSGRGDAGVVRVQYDLVTQDGVVAQTGLMSYLVRTRP